MICGQAGLLDRGERIRPLSQQLFALLNPPERRRLEPDMSKYSAVLTEQMVRNDAASHREASIPAA